jgi:hypothetical protein
VGGTVFVWCGFFCFSGELGFAWGGGWVLNHLLLQVLSHQNRQLIT